MKTTFLLVLSCFFLMSSLNAYEKAFNATPVGQIEIKTIPESVQLVTYSSGDYFKKANQLFMRLFNYIDTNKVSMTVPVEADLDESGMKFYVGIADQLKELKSTKDVEVIVVPERMVLSIGGRGSYTKKNVEKMKKKLEAWLDQQTDYKAVGSPYAVFWSGPFTPGFLKRLEVHIVIEKVEPIKTE